MPALPELPAGTSPGWVARTPVPADAQAVFELLVACDTAVLGAPDVALGDVVADLELDPHWQTVVVDGERVVAWAWLLDKAAGRTLADVYVDPGLPAEVGDRLAGWCWDVLLPRAARTATARGEAQTTVEVGSLDRDVRTEQRLRAAGFERARTFWRMRRRLVGADARWEPSPGVVIRPVDEGDGEVRTVHGLVESAFEDHWGHRVRSFEEWWRQLSTTFGFDLGLWWLAELDGRPAGILIGTSQMAEEDAMYISTLGTVESARGRGVGKSLLRQAFAAGLARGWSLAKLNVDSESPTAAPELYSRVGMTVDFAMHAWRLEVVVPA